MTIDIGQREEMISICEDDDPQELAIKFCLKHRLGLETAKIIEQNIIANTEEVLK